VKRRALLLAAIGTLCTVRARAQQPPDARIDFPLNVREVPSSAEPTLEQVAQAHEHASLLIGLIGSRDPREEARTGWNRAYAVWIALAGRHHVSLAGAALLPRYEEMVDGPYVRIILRQRIPMNWHLEDRL
jgi:hypothetical protein